MFECRTLSSNNPSCKKIKGGDAYTRYYGYHPGCPSSLILEGVCIIHHSWFYVEAVSQRPTCSSNLSIRVQNMVSKWWTLVKDAKVSFGPYILSCIVFKASLIHSQGKTSYFYPYCTCPACISEPPLYRYYTSSWERERGGTCLWQVRKVVNFEVLVVLEV